jgi:hypothetical protein
MDRLMRVIVMSELGRAFSLALVLKSRIAERAAFTPLFIQILAIPLSTRLWLAPVVGGS